MKIKKNEQKKSTSHIVDYTMERGITLIALIITIIVLLILVVITVSVVFSETGIIAQTRMAKEKQEVVSKEEEVYLAICSLMINVSGDKTKIKPSDIATEVNKNYIGTPITSAVKNNEQQAETYPTYIIYPDSTTSIKKQIKVEVNENLEVVKGGTIVEGTASQPNMPESPYGDLDVTVMPELFAYESLNENTVKVTGFNWDNNQIDALLQAELDTDSNSGSESGLIVIPDNIKTLVIPATVDVDGTEHTVTAIGDGAFEVQMDQGRVFSWTVEEVILPNTILEIGENAFACRSFSKLARINFPTNLTSIGNGAFTSCRRLTSITIPSSVTSIGYNAFCYCSELTNINIKKTQDSISDAPWGSTATITWNYAGD
ncbi:MAG: leucine-rich repeat domain-containing protein [Clostridia bacterium]|nr:leucine-rich repeat domain-containing protein [Clostridia bacterium]